jgi:4-amino-4-deoxychorismate lyase
MSAPVLVELVGPDFAPVVRDPAAPLLRADDVGALRGDGAFERFLVYRGRPRRFADHLARLARSGAMLGLALPPEAAWRAAVDLVVANWSGADEWEARLVATRGPESGGPTTAYVLGQPLAPSLLQQRQEGIAAITLDRGFASDLMGRAPWLLLGAKTLSYVVNMAAKREAEARGADDAIFLSTDGQVLEASTSAVVAAFGRRLVSPPDEVGILPSISLRHLLTDAGEAGWEAVREPLKVDDLKAADGVWATSSLRFVRIRSLDGDPLGPGEAHAELEALARRGTAPPQG